jgi:hypothetical protein
MKINALYLSAAIAINGILLITLASSSKFSYHFTESPSVIVTLWRYKPIIALPEKRNPQTEKSPPTAPRTLFKKASNPSDPSTIRPLAPHSQFEKGLPRLQGLPRLLVRCSALGKEGLSPEEREVCNERLGRSARAPSTPTYSIAIPPDKMAAYAEAYERQQELNGRPLPKVFVPTEGPGSNFGFGTMEAEPQR